MLLITVTGMLVSAFMDVIYTRARIADVVRGFVRAPVVHGSKIFCRDGDFHVHSLISVMCLFFSKLIL